MEPAQNPDLEKEQLLAFLGIESKDELALIEPLKYDALRNAILGTTKIAVVRQQEQVQQQQQQQQQQYLFIDENIEENDALIKRAKQLLENKNKPNIENHDDSDVLDMPCSLHRDTVGAQLRERLLGFLNNDTYRKMSAIVKAKTVHKMELLYGKAPKKDKDIDSFATILLTVINRVKSSFNQECALSEAVLIKIIDNLDYFVDGVSSSNLPAGFFLDSDKGCLKFDKGFAKKALESQDKEKNSYAKPAVLHDNWLKEKVVKQYDLIPIPDDASILAQLNAIEGTKPLGDNTLAILNFTNDNKAKAKILSILNNPADKNGKIKVYALLDTLIKIKKSDSRLYDVIKGCFIDKSEDLSEIANLDTLKAMEGICKFDQARKDWWCSLAEQHKGGVNRETIAELYGTFCAFYDDLNKFWHELYGAEQYLQLPYPCPVGPIENMSVALSRIADITKHAGHLAKDQLLLLRGLSLQEAQILANAPRKSNQYRVICPDMTSSYERRSSDRCCFLKALYADSAEEEHIYYPHYFTAERLWGQLEKRTKDFNAEIIAKDREKVEEEQKGKQGVILDAEGDGFLVVDNNISDRQQILKDAITFVEVAMRALASSMLRHRAQAGEVFKCLEELLLFVKSNVALKYINGKMSSQEVTDNICGKLPVLTMKYPLFHDVAAVPHPNSKYLELAMSNPTVRPDIFMQMDPIFKEKTPLNQQPPNGDITSCLLSIKNGEPDEIESIIDVLHSLYDGKRSKTLAVLAKILATTDFAETTKDKLISKEDLYAIIEECKKLPDSEIDDILVRKIISTKYPNVKFKQDLDYAKELLNRNRVPKDRMAILTLAEPLFVEAGVLGSEEHIDINVLPKLAQKVVDSNKGTAFFIINPLIGYFKVGDNIQEDRGKIFDGAMLLLQKTRDFSIPFVETPGAIIKKQLVEIKKNKKEEIVALLKTIGFEEKLCYDLAAPIDKIDLEHGKDLGAEFNKLLDVTAWISEFASHYIDIATLDKWKGSSKEFIELVNANFLVVKDTVNSLLEVYAPNNTNLTNENFCSPAQLLRKLLDSKKAITPSCIEVIKKIAQLQGDVATAISYNRMNLLLNLILKVRDSAIPNDVADKITAQLMDFVYNAEKKYGDFPTDSFLKFMGSFADKAMQDLELPLDNLALTYQGARTPADTKAVNSFVGILFNNKGMEYDQNICSRYLAEASYKLNIEQKKQIFKIIEQALEQELKQIEKKEELSPEDLSKLQTEIHPRIFALIDSIKDLYSSTKKEQQELAGRLGELYDQKPCPDTKQLLEILLANKKGNEEKVKEFLGKFEIDPYAKRLKKNGESNEAYLHGSEQFATNKVDRIILELRNANPDSENDEFYQGLKSDFNYVNTIGSFSNFSGKSENNKPIWKMTGKAIRDNLAACQNIMQDGKKTAAEKYLARLQAIALLRESMYRATGKMPNSTQVISVIIQAKVNNNTCMQINTGEGKSLTNPLLAALQHYNGFSVNVFTSNTDLAERDDKEARDFWKYLGIPTALVLKDSPNGTYLPNGVNYTTPGDFALYSASVRNRSGGDKFGKMAGVYDESDLAFYEIGKDYNFADSIGKKARDPYKNQFAWVYPHINNFIDTNDKYGMCREQLARANDDVAKDKINRQIVGVLRLCLQSADPQQYETLIKTMDDTYLLRWLAAAERVKALEEGKNYVVENFERTEFGEKKQYSGIYLLDDEGHKSVGDVLANGGQQLLGARLQAKKEWNLPFPCDPEILCVSSTNAHTELLGMNRVVGITGTLGHKNLLVEFKKHHAMTDFKIPPHNPNKRMDLPPEFANDHDEHTRRIKKELKKCVSNAQLVIGSDFKQCTGLYDELKEFANYNGISLLLVTAKGYKIYNGKTKEESGISNMDDVITYAGRTKTVTISTPILGRGVNLGPNLTKVIKVNYDPNERIESQIDGRTGRYGNVGATIGIFNWDTICKTQPYASDKFGITSVRDRRDILTIIRAKAQEEEIARLHLSIAKEISVEYQKYFDCAIDLAKEQQDFDAAAILLLKYQFIQEAEDLSANMLPKNAVEINEEYFKKFKDEVEKIWLRLSGNNQLKPPDILHLGKKLAKKISREKLAEAGSKGAYCKIGISHLAGSNNDLVTQYQSRNQRIYADEVVDISNAEENDKIVKQFKADLDAIARTQGRFPSPSLNTDSAKIVIEKDVKPYFTFIQNCKEKGKNAVLVERLNNALTEHIQTIFPLTNNGEHAYLYRLCQSWLVASGKLLPTAPPYDIKNLTHKDKEACFACLKTCIEKLPNKMEIFQNIIGNKPTGNYEVDYYVMLIKKMRGFFRTHSFGDTTTFKQLTKYAAEQLKKPFGLKRQPIKKASPNASPFSEDDNASPVKLKNR